MKDARTWTRTAYRADAYQSALAKLSDAEYLDGSPALLNNLSHHLPTAIVWVLE